MNACSHHAKLGVTPTTSPGDRPAEAPWNAGLQESAGPAGRACDRRFLWTMLLGEWLQPLLEVDVGPGASPAAGAPRAATPGAPVPVRVLRRPPAAAVVPAGRCRRATGVQAPGSGGHDLEGDSQGGRLIRRACHRIQDFHGRQGHVRGPPGGHAAPAAGHQRGPPRGHRDRRADAPAVTSPVRRPAPSTRLATSTPRTAARSTAPPPSPRPRVSPWPGSPRPPVGRWVGSPRAGCAPLWTTSGPSLRRCATLSLRGAEPGSGSLKGVLGPVVGLTGSACGRSVRRSPRSGRRWLRWGRHSLRSGRGPGRWLGPRSTTLGRSSLASRAPRPHRLPPR